MDTNTCRNKLVQNLTRNMTVMYFNLHRYVIFSKQGMDTRKTQWHAKHKNSNGNFYDMGQKTRQSSCLSNVQCLLVSVGSVVAVLVVAAVAAVVASAVLSQSQAELQSS